MNESTKLVLVIEEDNDVRSSFEEILLYEGHQVLLASNGLEGLKILEQLTHLPNLILLDRAMPVMDGATFRMKQLADHRLSQIPVLLLTSHPHIQKLAAQMETNFFLRKPVDLNELILKINLAMKLPSF